MNTDWKINTECLKYKICTEQSNFKILHKFLERETKKKKKTNPVLIKEKVGREIYTPNQLEKKKKCTYYEATMSTGVN